MRWTQHCPYSLEPKKYGANAKSPLPRNDSQKLTNKEINKVQQIVGSILYYAWTVDITVLMVLSAIASEQTKGMEHTMEKAYQVLEYLATHSNTMLQFQASDMVMNIHSNALLLTKPNSCSRASGHFSYAPPRKMANLSN
jgi:hypothetical protein